MQRNKGRHWFWNLLIVVTLVAALTAFAVHYKNWVRIESNHFSVLSGIYYKEIPYSELDSVSMVPKIPKMERITGFSAMRVEKGIFLDSVSRYKVRVFVDNLEHPKIRMVYQDSLLVFLNYRDSTETRKMFEFLQTKITTDFQKP